MEEFTNCQKDYPSKSHTSTVIPNCQQLNHVPVSAETPHLPVNTFTKPTTHIFFFICS